MCLGHVSVQALYAYIHALFAICMSELDGRDVAITFRGLTWQQNVAPGEEMEQGGNRNKRWCVFVVNKGASDSLQSAGCGLA